MNREKKITTRVSYGNALAALGEKKEAIALMRTIPGMTIISPTDDVEAKAAVEAAILTSAMKTGKVVTVEEHSVIGGLGSAVADVVSAKNAAKVLKIGVQDIFGQSGSGMELIKEYGLNSESIFKKIKDFLSDSE